MGESETVKYLKENKLLWCADVIADTTDTGGTEEESKYEIAPAGCYAIFNQNGDPWRAEDGRDSYRRNVLTGCLEVYGGAVVTARKSAGPPAPRRRFPGKSSTTTERSRSSSCEKSVEGEERATIFSSPVSTLTKKTVDGVVTEIPALSSGGRIKLVFEHELQLLIPQPLECKNNPSRTSDAELYYESDKEIALELLSWKSDVCLTAKGNDDCIYDIVLASKWSAKPLRKAMGQKLE
eukprot:g4805.t1